MINQLVFAQESLVKVWDEIFPLTQQHWAESEEHREWQGFNPDKRRYLYYEELGIYFHFTARHDGVIAGSAGLFVMPSMHTQRKIAQEDTYYLLPQYRQGWNAIHFLKFTEEFLRERGVVEILITTPLINVKSETIVRRVGYRQISKGWSKRLETEHVHAIGNRAAGA